MIPIYERAIEIRVYTRLDGREPFKEWLEALDARTQERIEARLSRFREGNFGDHKSIGHGLFEARLFFGPGYRIYFGRLGDTIVLLLAGGDKSSQRRDLRRAMDYFNLYLEAQDANEK